MDRIILEVLIQRGDIESISKLYTSNPNGVKEYIDIKDNIKILFSSSNIYPDTFDELKNLIDAKKMFDCSPLKCIEDSTFDNNYKVFSKSINLIEYNLLKYGNILPNNERLKISSTLLKSLINIISGVSEMKHICISQIIDVLALFYSIPSYIDNSLIFEIVKLSIITKDIENLYNISILINSTSVVIDYYLLTEIIINNVTSYSKILEISRTIFDSLSYISKSYLNMKGKKIIRFVKLILKDIKETYPAPYDLINVSNSFFNAFPNGTRNFLYRKINEMKVYHLFSEYGSLKTADKLLELNDFEGFDILIEDIYRRRMSPISEIEKHLKYIIKIDFNRVVDYVCSLKDIINIPSLTKCFVDDKNEREKFLSSVSNFIEF